MGPWSATSMRRWGLRCLLFAALTAVTWPVSGVTAAGGADPSWQIALPLGLADGLVWGRDIVFTYGPLGFSAHPLAVTSGTFLPALLIAAAVQFGLVGVLYVALRRQYGPLGTTALTFLVASAVGSVQSDSTLVIGFGVAALALTAPTARGARASRALAVAGAALVAFSLLVKLNDGVALAAIMAVALAASPSPRRALAIGFGSGLVTLIVLWLLLSQPLPAIFDYLRNGVDTVTGYVEAMGVEEAGGAAAWQLLVLVGSAAVLSSLAWRSFADLGGRRRGALVVAILLAHYFVLREVFVRHDLARGDYLVLLVPVALMVPWPRGRRAPGLAVAAVLTVAFLVSFPGPSGSVWDPSGKASAMVDQLGAGLDASEREGLIETGKGSVFGADQVPERLVDDLRGHCVSAEPTEIAIVWLYSLDWCPLPALQSYAAYTSRLDHLDADRYADPEKGPSRVIRNYAAIDGRLSAWESPAAMLSLLCNFEEIDRGGAWQVLGRVPDRCGRPRHVATVRGSLGEAIALPPAPPGTVEVAHVDGMQIGGLERLEMLFGRPEARTIRIDDGRPHRVVPDTVDDGLVVNVPASVDFAPPFNIGFGATSLTPEVDGQDGDVTIDVTAVPIR